MIRIEIEARDAATALDELAVFLRTKPETLLPELVAAGNAELKVNYQDRPAAGERNIAQETVDGLKSFSDHIAGKPTDGVVTVVEAPRRGRPRKAQNALSVEHTPNAQPAVATNTGSSAAASSPATPPANGASEQAGTAEAPATPAASPSFTAEQVRAKLQEFLAKPGGDAGMALASKVLARFGFLKVKQLTDCPEHYAAAVAAVDAEMAKLA